MKYCIVEDGIITNIIICDNPDYAKSLGALEYYEGATIGKKYEDKLTRDINSMKHDVELNSAQIRATSDRQDFLEDCIAEMAGQVYS